MNQKDIETLAIALPEDILKAKWCLSLIHI